MEQKIKQILITIALLLGYTNAIAYDFKVNGIYYNILPTEFPSVEITYKDTNYDSYAGDVEIPEQIVYKNTNYVVSSIGENAFCNCSLLTTISIPQTIKGIKSRAFYNCNHLNTVNITNLSSWCNIKYTNHYSSPLYYGAELHLNGELLKNINTITNDCDSIGDYAFYKQSSLIDVIIPNNISYIGMKSFFDCSKIEKLSIGADVELINTGAFHGCTSLRTIIFCDSEKTLEISNSSYLCFKDSPLNTIYIGRKLNIDTGDYGSYIPFTKVKNAIITINTSLYYFYNTNDYTGATTTNLENIYFGNNVSEIGWYPTQKIKNVYCFSANIEKNTNKGKGETIYVINKDQLPEVFASMNNVTFKNLADLSNIKTGETYEYGTKNIPFLSPSIVNNVINMNAIVNTKSLNINTGHYNDGLPISFTNELWSIDVYYPFEYTIKKAPLTIIANDAERQYGEDNPEFSCSYFGFKNGETDSVLITKPTIATTATINSSVGSYPIIPTNAEAKNYTFTYERGNLTVTQASQTINWDQSFEKVFVGDQIELTAKATSGLTVKYSISDESIAEIYTSNGKTYLDCIKGGEVTLKANQSGNDNYLSADRVTKTIVINKNSGINNVNDNNNVIEIARYDIHGRLLSEPSKGVNIIKYSDGSTRKGVVK